jgi:hypothetical protein
MQITNCGRGVHKREVAGVEKLKLLPPKWYAFTNLEIAVTAGKGREIDAVIVAEDRIFLVDLKEWHGTIESENGHWIQNGQDRGPSPVAKIIQNARDVFILLGKELRKRAPGHAIPHVQGIVVISGGANWSQIAEQRKRPSLGWMNFAK